jgi:hypothetical protein
MARSVHETEVRHGLMGLGGIGLVMTLELVAMALCAATCSRHRFTLRSSRTLPAVAMTTPNKVKASHQTDRLLSDGSPNQ